MKNDLLTCMALPEKGGTAQPAEERGEAAADGGAREGRRDRDGARARRSSRRSPRPGPARRRHHLLSASPAHRPPSRSAAPRRGRHVNSPPRRAGAPRRRRGGRRRPRSASGSPSCRASGPCRRRLRARVVLALAVVPALAVRRSGRRPAPPPRPWCPARRSWRPSRPSSSPRWSPSARWSQSRPGCSGRPCSRPPPLRPRRIAKKMPTAAPTSTTAPMPMNREPCSSVVRRGWPPRWRPVAGTWLPPAAEGAAARSHRRRDVRPANAPSPAHRGAPEAPPMPRVARADALELLGPLLARRRRELAAVDRGHGSGGLRRRPPGAPPPRAGRTG